MTQVPVDLQANWLELEMPSVVPNTAGTSGGASRLSPCKTTQHSAVARAAMYNRVASMTAPPDPALDNITNITLSQSPTTSQSLLEPPSPTAALGRAPPTLNVSSPASQDGSPLVNTPAGSSTSSTAPGSPRLLPVRQNSGSATPRIRAPATTLNIPGMTRSRISPDGKIAQRDVGAKLVLVMVGLPARGKSYITKKIQRYLSWQQHECRIFNVGARRRVAAGTGLSSSPQSPSQSLRKQTPTQTGSLASIVDAPTKAAHILLNRVYNSPHEDPNDLSKLPSADTMEQSAQFFDPKNEKASQIREQVALSTLDELLDFLLNEGGSVGILDATNSTIERRKVLFNAIKEREPKLGILFIESVCEDKKLLEANMHLKLKGPDYKDKDPESSLADFKKRVEAYESAYVPLGKFEEDKNMQYIKMIDVGRKVIHYRLQGFLSNGIASYLSTFNLSPRQIWITRHGQSEDNLAGKIGGDSNLTEAGHMYATTLYNFVSAKRQEWELDQKTRALETAAQPLQLGDQTPPYPDILGELDEKNFCVWTSMLQRSIQTAEWFQEDENYDVKNWEMLKELDAGSFEGMTYEDIADKFPEQYAKRRADKLSYIYPGVGGEGYLQVISRLRDMVREIERIKDHVLLIGHRSVCRVLMAYFMDLTRDDIADLDVPIGMLFAIEPKPYGIEFHAYKYNAEACTFNEIPNYKPQKAVSHSD